MYVGWTALAIQRPDLALDRRRRSLRRRAHGGRVLADPDSPLRHRDRHPRRPAFVHPGEPDRLRRRLRRPFSGRVYVSYTGTDVSPAFRARADDLRQPAPAALGLPVSGQHRIVPPSPASATPTSSGCSRPSIRRTALSGSASTTRPATPMQTAAHYSCSVSHERRADLDAAGSRGARPPPTSPCPEAASTATTRVSPRPHGVAHPIWTDTRRFRTSRRGDLHGAADACGLHRLAAARSRAGERSREVVGDLVERGPADSRRAC